MAKTDRLTRQVIDWNGGASRDRTDDLIVANDALSQLSYSPGTNIHDFIIVHVEGGTVFNGHWAARNNNRCLSLPFLARQLDHSPESSHRYVASRR
jgi:hypothetical protein